MHPGTCSTSKPNSPQQNVCAHPFFILASQICCKPSQTQRCAKNFWLMNCLDAMTDITSNLHFSKSLNQRAPEAWSLFVYYDHRLVVLSILIQFWCDAARSQSGLPAATTIRASPDRFCTWTVTHELIKHTQRPQNRMWILLSLLHQAPRDSLRGALMWSIEAMR